jgi:hypothetical protein
MYYSFKIIILYFQQYVQDTKLREAFQWRETWKCFVLTMVIIIFILGVLRDPSNVRKYHKYI